ncbi:unnamed protein product, partial [Urochloa humidicola]
AARRPHLPPVVATTREEREAEEARNGRSLQGSSPATTDDALGSELRGLAATCWREAFPRPARREMPRAARWSCSRRGRPAPPALAEPAPPPGEPPDPSEVRPSRGGVTGSGRGEAVTRQDPAVGSSGV